MEMREMNRRELIQGGLCTATLLGLPAMALEQPESKRAQEGLRIDASRVPLSRLGSYLAIGFRFWDFGLGEQVTSGSYYIRCLQDDPSPPEIFRIEMLTGDRVVAPAAEVTPGQYTLRHADARVEFCIAENDLILVRGAGCKLRLHTITRGYANAIHRSADVWWIIPDPLRLSVEVRNRVGRMDVDAPWVDRPHNVQVDKAVLTFTPAAEGTFETSMLFYQAVPRRQSHEASFDRSRDAVETEFAAWAQGIPALAPQFEAGRKLAAYVMWSDTVAARGLYSTPVVWGSKNWMARIWSWDHCFCALGLAQSHPELAWQQFILMRDMQDPISGMLADSTSNIQRSWLCTKDPVHGWAFSRLLRLMPATITRERLQEAYAVLRLWTEFWINNRDFDGDGLPCIIHPDESFDNTTNNSVGAAAKPPEIATYLALQMDALCEIATKLGYASDARHWQHRSQSLVRTMLASLWEPGKQRFVSRRVGDGYVAPGDCLLTYMPLMLGERLPPEIRSALIRGLKRPGGFVTPYGLSTEALDSPLYNRDSYVKGPTWAPLNAFLIEALFNVGETALAAKIQASFCQTVLAGGGTMSEHFDTRTGAPGGDPAYNWTAALFLLLANQKHQDGNLWA